MDVHMGEGPSYSAEKFTKMGARMVTECINASLDVGQAWMNDLKLLVGGDVWYKMSEDRQIHLIELRAELLTADNHVDKLCLLSSSLKPFIQDPAGMYALPTQPKVLQAATLSVYESTKEHRRAEQAAVGAVIKLSFDFTKQSGENVGEEWLLTVKNESGQTVGKKAGRSTKYEDYRDFIQEIGARENVNAELIVIDDLVESAAGEYDKRSQLLLDWIPTATEVITDRFHVVKTVNEGFNNFSDFFYPLMVVKQRDVVATRDFQLEQQIDVRLRKGTAPPAPLPPAPHHPRACGAQSDFPFPAVN